MYTVHTKKQTNSKRVGQGHQWGSAMVFRSKAEPQGRQVSETDFLKVSRMALKEMTTESCGGVTVIVLKIIFIEETIN